MPRTQNRRLTTDELARVAAISEALFAADTANLPVTFTYTKDDGTSSLRMGLPNGVFGQEAKTSLSLKADKADEFGKTFNVRNMTDLRVIL
jgi:hypothetical protein